MARITAAAAAAIDRVAANIASSVLLQQGRAVGSAMSKRARRAARAPRDAREREKRREHGKLTARGIRRAKARKKDERKVTLQRRGQKASRVVAGMFPATGKE